jgi:hypothetical protein
MLLLEYHHFLLKWIPDLTMGKSSQPNSCVYIEGHSQWNFTVKSITNRVSEKVTDFETPYSSNHLHRPQLFQSQSDVVDNRVSVS